MKIWHLTPLEKRWLLTREGSEEAADFPTQWQGIDAGMRLAARNHGCVKIHGIDGTVTNERAFPKPDAVVIH